jgi:hypothetical protein
MGKRHSHMPVPQISAAHVPEQNRLYAYDEAGKKAGFSYFEDGVLIVFNVNGGILAKVIKEDNQLVVYDAEGEQQGYFEQKDGAIAAYNMSGKLIGNIVTRDGKAVFLFAS